MIRPWIHAWERKLSRVDKNRVTRPFDWGFHFLNHGFVPSGDPKDSIARFNQIAIQDSSTFYRHLPVSEFRKNDDRLTFPSSIQNCYPQNNTASCRLFEAAGSDRAVVVLPQWNAGAESHTGLCKLLRRFGFTAARLTLPYHEERNPSGPRAEFMVSSNIGRTIQAIQQSVLDARNIADWLRSQGYKKIGIMGTSVGSCIAFLTYVHDERFQVGVFNHVSSFFGDVVWNGISTQHVRKGVQPVLTSEELRHAWAVISPNTYVHKLRNFPDRRRLYISARYDLTFPPDLAGLLFEEHEHCNIPYEVAYLPCGHYTSALAPFKYLDGYHICRYFLKHL